MIYSAGSDDYFHTSFQNIAKQNKRRMKIKIATGRIVGVAKGIIDGTYVLLTHQATAEKVVIIFTHGVRPSQTRAMRENNGCGLVGHLKIRQPCLFFVVTRMISLQLGLELRNTSHQKFADK